jgi:CheY-like chemotaxis protein
MNNADEGVSVLVVDDDPSLRNLIRRILQSRGYKAILAANAVEALEAAEADDPSIDVLLTDLAMPGLGGLELASRLRRWRSDLSIVIMSGDIAPELRRSEPRMAFLPKPFSPDDLIAAIVSVVPPS